MDGFLRQVLQLQLDSEYWANAFVLHQI